jgi:DNA-binding CsgD family transcriptional regulator
MHTPGPGARTVAVKLPMRALSDRERKILRLLADDEPDLVKICEQLGISPRTLAYDVESVSKAVQFAWLNSEEERGTSDVEAGLADVRWQRHPE